MLADSEGKNRREVRIMRKGIRSRWFAVLMILTMVITIGLQGFGVSVYAGDKQTQIHLKTDGFAEGTVVQAIIQGPFGSYPTNSDGNAVIEMGTNNNRQYVSPDLGEDAEPLVLAFLINGIEYGFTAGEEGEGTINYTLGSPIAPATYTVTFDSQGGSSVAPITGIADGGTAGTLPVPTRDGFTFGGWFPDKSEDEFKSDTPVTCDITVYAAWIPVEVQETFTVTFDSQGGSAVAPITGVVSGTTVTLPSNPTKAANAFASWNIIADGSGAAFTSETEVTADITVYAQWTPAATYTVTFDSQGGSAVAPITGVVSGTTVTLPSNPTKAANTFASWNTAADGSGTVFTSATQVTADITVYAQWTPDTPAATYTVTFDSQGGSAVAPITGVVSGGKVILPSNPTFSGKTFAGWNIIADGSGAAFTADTAVIADITVYAQWTAIPVVEDDDPDPVTPTPSSSGSSRTRRTIQDRPEPEVITTVVPEVTPLAAPVLPEMVPEAVPAPVEIVAEVAPLGVAVLPKTGELPASLFYGLGGMLTAMGAFLKRK